jgi:hypothetical protein
MKQFIKVSSIALLFALSVGSQLVSNVAVAPMGTAQAIQSDTSGMSSRGGQAVPAASPAPSVHEMFKDIPQDQLLQMMEEGQQFIKYLEEHGTPEEKMAFAQAMEETLQGFTEDDWNEFNAIVETVQDKLPPLVIDEPVVTPVEKVKEEVKEVKPVVIVDNSLEKVLHAIHKAINSLLLKAKSDKILTERITIGWENKDKFNEMDRLLQSLNKKDLIAKLTTSNDEAIKSLLESIENFNKRLQIENDAFVIADTFGLQADEQTTAFNLKKLNKILEFFDTAIESLLPKLIKFLEEYEPEALKKAKEHDDSAKKALEHATKVENQQKRPANNHQYSDRSAGNKNKNQSQGNYTPYYAQGGQAAPREITPSYMEQTHRENLKNIPASKKSGMQGGAGSSDKAEDKNKKENKDSQYNNAIDNLASYLETNTNTEVGNYMTTMQKTQNIYNPFGDAIDEQDYEKAANIHDKQSRSVSLDMHESRFVQKHDERVQAAEKNFAKNTQAAHSYYEKLSESIATIAPQIEEMIPVIQAIKASLAQMNSKELEKLFNAPSLKNFGDRITKYHTTFKNAQSELRNKHRLHALKRDHAQAYSTEQRAYDDLAAKVDSLHGLDKKIADAKAQFDSLHKAIKSTMAKRKREENKKDKN